MTNENDKSGTRASRWCRLARRRWLPLHVALLGAVVGSLAYLSRFPVDPDWLTLFQRDDPVLATYLDCAGGGVNQRTLYVKVAGLSGDGIQAFGARLRALTVVESVVPLPVVSGAGAGAVWFSVVLGGNLTASEREQAVLEVRTLAEGVGSECGVTGAEAILMEFRQSVQGDMVRSLVVSLLLVSIALVVVFGPTPVLFLGIVYELSGLVIAMALCVAVSGPLNMLSAAVPCVLVGVGADFVIHCIAAAEEAGGQGEAVGARLYHGIGVPMFWGALATAAAFFSLGFADLRGLRGVGLLGGLGVLCMYGVVMVFLPAAMDRWSVKRWFAPNWVPRKPGSRGLWAATVAGVCVLAGCFVGRLRSEQRIENLYDPSLPSLQLQRELAGALGVYPSLLYASVQTRESQRVMEVLMSPELPFQVDPFHVQMREDDDGGTQMCIPLFCRTNPFDPQSYHRLEEALLARLALVSGTQGILTGDAALSSHLDRLLQRGMARACVAVFVLFAVILGGAFRCWRYAAAPLVALGIALFGVLGAMGLLGIALSAYTLTLAPLFVGIGIDDLLYVSYSMRAGKPLCRAPRLVVGITMTTVTTVLGYGSLTVARNLGFAAMGRTAVLGLLVMYASAVFVLPVLLGQRGMDPSSAT